MPSPIYLDNEKLEALNLDQYQIIRSKAHSGRLKTSFQPKLESIKEEVEESYSPRLIVKIK